MSILLFKVIFNGLQNYLHFRLFMWPFFTVHVGKLSIHGPAHIMGMRHAGRDPYAWI